VDWRTLLTVRAATFERRVLAGEPENLFNLIIAQLKIDSTWEFVWVDIRTS